MTTNQHVPEIQIRHIRVVEDGVMINNAGATIAYAAEDDGVHYALAFCGPYDNFNKMIGRQCAVGRLQRCEHTVACIPLAEFEDTIQDIVTNPESDNHGLSLALNSTIGASIPAAYINFSDEELSGLMA